MSVVLKQVEASKKIHSSSIQINNIPSKSNAYTAFKRLFDFVFALSIIIALFPILIPLIFILQKVTSRGTVFFVQKRYGLNNEIFNLYKFRTYKIENCSHNLNLSVNNNTITSFGKFLKFTNLDELPQMINILKGDMSLIGPRPHAINFHNYYKGIINNTALFNARATVRPGIIGLSQVLYLRGDVEDPAINRVLILSRFTVDKLYAENLTFAMDAKILWKLAFGSSKKDNQMLEQLEQQFSNPSLHNI